LRRIKEKGVENVRFCNEEMQKPGAERVERIADGGEAATKCRSCGLL
jgi:hypothetical protein